MSTSLEAIVESMGGQSRVGQREMAEAVMGKLPATTSSCRQARHEVLPAHLVPAARVAARKGPVWSTATLALQRQLIERELPRLAGQAGTFPGRC